MGRSAENNPVTVRLPADLRESMEDLLEQYPLIRKSEFLAFAVENALAMMKADGTIVEQFVRHRRSREPRQRLARLAKERR